MRTRARTDSYDTQKNKFSYRVTSPTMIEESNKRNGETGYVMEPRPVCYLKTLGRGALQ